MVHGDYSESDHELPVMYQVINYVTIFIAVI